MDASEKLRRVFEDLDRDGNGRIWAWELLRKVGQAGIDPFESRVRSALDGARDADGQPLQTGPDQQPVQIDYPEFIRIAQHGDGVIGRALNGELAVSPADWAQLCAGAKQIYEDLLANLDGENAQYIATLRDANPNQFGVAICSADGQLYKLGDCDVPFSVQSTSKPFTYAMALEELGSAEVDRWIGTEQSGGTFNDPMRSFDPNSKPHNGMINAGAIGAGALVGSGKAQSERFHLVKETWTAMMGKAPGFDNETFLAEDETGDGNRQLAFAMAARGRLKGAGGLTSTAAAVEWYHRLCSQEVDAARLAAAGATLANGGVAPYSGKRVFSHDTTRRVLSVMQHSGMYDGSGEFAHQVGLPAKSGVSGNVMLILPDQKCSVVVFSPPLNEVGNSVRGVEFAKRLVNDFNLHPYDRRTLERTRTTEADRPRNEADIKAHTARQIAAALSGMASVGSNGPAALGGAPDAAAAMKAKGSQQTGPQL
ncbi:glutaminase A [Kribbella sp. NPDC004536]|uniref:glutaminase A n=1 Tax=Kribbella sp. NPDC004536 TaxID=3364106 RepID=UPI0036A7E061